jgi:hypothetical protein
MGGLTFTHLALLGGLTALAIPILIHLLFRRPVRQMRFSTLEFFLEKREEAARRRRIRHWLLLVTRCLILLLVVVAFARPYSRQRGQAAKIKRDIVLVLDRSASMQVEDRWSKAQAKAQSFLRDLGFEDRAALVEASVPVKVLSPFAPVSKVQTALRTLSPGFGAADLAQGLTEAVRMLQKAEPDRRSSIVIISDFQRTGAGATNEIRLPNRIDLTLDPVGEESTPNIAIVDLSLETDGRLGIKCRRFGEGAPALVSAEVLADGQCFTNCLLTTTSTATQAVTLPALGPGWHTIETRVAAQPGGNPEKLDLLPADNRRWLALKVPAPLQILVVEPRPSQRSFEEESFFIACALASASTNGIPCRCQKVPTDQLVSALATKDFGLVILPQLRQLDEGLGAELRAYVTNGGGLLLFLGEATAPVRYQCAFGDLLPMSLRRAEGDPDKPEEFWHIGEFDTASPVFAAFRRENSGDPTRPAFKRRFALQAAAGSDVVARFADGVPFILTKKLGQGRVVAINTSADTAWTDWPKRKTYVPWLEGVIALAVGKPIQAGITAGPDLPCGIQQEVPINSVQTVKLRGPGGEQHVEPHAGTISLCLEKPGVFATETLGGLELGRVTASVPKPESDLAAMTVEEFSKSITRTSDPGLRGLTAAFSGDGSREFWRILLLIALGLLIAEFLLANRTWA